MGLHPVDQEINDLPPPLVQEWLPEAHLVIVNPPLAIVTCTFLPLTCLQTGQDTTRKVTPAGYSRPAYPWGLP